jgi:hypothetical protein
MAVDVGRHPCIAVRGGTTVRWPFAARPPRAKTAVRRLFGLTAAALTVSTIACSAGPCAPEIARMQARLDAGLEAKAATGQSAPESPGALSHRQPTPGSIAAVESGLGEISPEKARAIREAMARAREADQAGDKVACEQALAEVQRTIGP